VGGMYLKFLRLTAAVCLLFTFWSERRLFDISIFEVLAPLVILLALPYHPKEPGIGLDTFRLAIIGVAISAFAGVISTPASFDPYEHILKVLKLVGAFVLVVGLAYVLTNRKILTTVELFYLLALSSAVCSFVAILQGQFGMLLGLLPKADNETVTNLSRMTGLAGHPIETGIISAYGAVIALGIGIYTRRWLFIAMMIAIDIYSMKFSASITAFFACLTAITAVCIYTKKYHLLVGGFVASVLALTIAAALSNGTSLLETRLASLAQSQNNFVTVQSREMQLQKALTLIDAKTLFIGNGYSTADLPYKMEIHNGVIASVFHFGLLGFVSQCFLISFFVSRLRHDALRPLKAVHIGCVIVFSAAYLSGPPQARPSLWAPMLFLGAYLWAPRPTKEKIVAVRSQAVFTK
jgi:hypothetical protein